MVVNNKKVYCIQAVLTGCGKCKIRGQQVKPAWQYTPVIPEHSRWRQEDQDSATRVGLFYIKLCQKEEKDKEDEENEEKRIMRGRQVI